MKYSGIRGETDQGHMLCSITCLYHLLEKGLSMKQTRPLFGEKAINNLTRLLRTYVAGGYDLENTSFQTAMHTLRAYREFHSQNPDLDGSECPLNTVILFLDEHDLLSIKRELGGGKRDVSCSEIKAAAKGPFPDLVNSRHSVRHFSDTPVPDELIVKAVRWAQRSPSSCNRQCARVIAVRDRDRIKKALAIQGGSRGFGEDVDKLLVVAGDMHSFRSSIERNQIYCDGGLFGMLLLLGLHHQGLGACPLHWCVGTESDKALRKALDIEDALSIVMLIGVGSLDSDFKIAYSQRLETSQVLFWR